MDTGVEMDETEQKVDRKRKREESPEPEVIKVEDQPDDDEVEVKVGTDEEEVQVKVGLDEDECIKLEEPKTEDLEVPLIKIKSTDSEEPKFNINTSIFETEDDQNEVGDVEMESIEGSVALPCAGTQPKESAACDSKPKFEKVECESTMPNVLENRKRLMDFNVLGDCKDDIKVVQPNPSLRFLSYEGKAPPPKQPKTAHYRSHTQEEELKYVEDYRKNLPAAIPNPDPETDDEDEEVKVGMDPALNSRFVSERAKVFSEVDFETRSVDVSGLAAYQQKEKILEAIENNRIVIIDGFTGCGKTTQVPQFIIDRAYETKKPCNVIVTQPRKLAAVSVARRVCAERGWPVGKVVGYQVSMDKKCENSTLVTFMTVGVLLQMLSRKKSLKRWTHIIIDEVHERDLHTDLLLLFIKKILLDDLSGKERHVKIILMSATLDAEKFSKYLLVESTGTVLETPIIQIPSARLYNVEEIFLDRIVSDEKELQEIQSNLDHEKAGIVREIYSSAVKVIVGLDDPNWNTVESGSGQLDRASGMRKDRGSVLVFLPGLAEIKTLEKFLQEENSKIANTSNPDGYKWNIVPLHSSITGEEQAKVFDRPKPFVRKIILSTNIAESSITVADIIYANCVDPRTNFSCLRTCWASVNQCIQRKGRTGRVANGKVFRMVPRDFFMTLAQEAPPEMLRSSLESVVLQVKTLDMGSPRELLCLALDPPAISGIERAVCNLKELGALTIWNRKICGRNEEGEGIWQEFYDPCDGEVTFMGKVMSSLPVSPACCRLILLGHCLGVMKEAIIVAAGLSSKSPFSAPYNQQLNSYLKKLQWAKTSYSDCFAILYAYKEYERQYMIWESAGASAMYARERRWGKTWSIQTSQMREMRNMIEEISERIKVYIPTSHSINKIDGPLDAADISNEAALMLKIAIAGAFYPNYFHRHRPDLSCYERERAKEVAGNDVFSTVFYRNFPPNHVAQLYSKIIADALAYEKAVPRIKFDGQKVFAIFDNSGKKIGPICESIYRAVKKRQVRDNLEFRVMWREEEKVELERQNQERLNRRFLRCPEQVRLPHIGITEITVCVSYVESPSQFWVIKETRKGYLEAMVDEINQNLEGRPTRAETAIGALVLAPYKDEVMDKPIYYRARIDASRSDHKEHLVYFIDYGNSEWVQMNELRRYPEKLIDVRDYHNVPAMAIECRLSEIKPALVYGSVWTEEALVRFKNLVADMKTMRFKIYAINNSIIIGELILQVPGERDFNFNNWLVDMEYADRVRENYVTELRHMSRLRYNEMRNDRHQIEGCNQQQYAQPLDRDFLNPPQNANTLVCLKGPYSPLELDFQSLCHSTSSKSVTVDNFSVNSVVLDTEPTAPTSRLLVAATLSIQDKSGRVVARDTTIMPATPGMISLMSLIFATKVELRCNNGRSRYTGVLCGLGTDPNGEPIYMDHDMEIVFDTEIDDKDVNTINEIRYNLNVILRDNVGANTSGAHEDLRKKILMLLKRNRKRLDEEIWPHESYVWNRISTANIIRAPRNQFPVLPLDVFMPHDTICLTADDPSLMQWKYAV